MRARASKDGLTLRIIAGTNNVLLAMDLEAAKRTDCLGFTIERMDIETGDRRWLPNMLRFRGDPNPKSVTTARAPLQKFRWGDYTLTPGQRYRYRVIARYGTPSQIVKEGVEAEKLGAFDSLRGGVTLEIRTEDPRHDDTAVFFNRGAAASEAYVRRFGDNDPDKIPDAKVWLSRGLEEAILGFIAKAVDKKWALHAAVYEFEKPQLVGALKEAKDRGADVLVVYHARQKPGGKDHTLDDNKAAIKAAKIDFATPRKANPSGAIMHNKFVVLLYKQRSGKWAPRAVWTGSTNWTDGGIYGQLNVGHAIYEPDIAEKYEGYFQALAQDLSAADSRKAVETLTPVPSKRAAVPHGITPIFSPQKGLEMIDLYAEICKNAKVLLVSAPFLLHEKIRKEFDSKPKGTLRFLLADKEGSFGKKGEIEIVQRNPANVAAVATVLKSALNDFQGNLLEHTESFHHAGVHIHSKIILADPFGSDPILVTGSANFSTNSTKVNDSNSLIIRGDTAVADIYSTEFMRMFEHYWFRYRQKQKEDEAKASGVKLDKVLALADDDGWSEPYYKDGTDQKLDRQAFSGLAI